MALRFFYRRQKMVLIIMVALMVSFLIGFQGFEMLFGRGGGRQTVGRAAWGKVRDIDVWTAQADLEVLGALAMFMGRYGPQFDEYYGLSELYAGSGKQAHLAYALLVGEAEHAGVRVSSGDIENFFPMWGFGADGGAKLLARLKEGDRDLDEKRLHGAVGRLLMIHKNSLQGARPGTPSAPELQYAYRDLFEKVALSVARLRADDYLAEARQPGTLTGAYGAIETAIAAAQDAAAPVYLRAMSRRCLLALAGELAVQARFHRYRQVDPGSYASGAKVSETFGFGYRYLLPRADIVYATVDPDVVERALGVEEAQDAKAKEGLKSQAKAKWDELAKQVPEMLTRYARLKQPPRELLEFYRDAGIVESAKKTDEMLDQKIETVWISAKPLEEAAGELAKAGKGVKKILLPDDTESLDVKVNVDLHETAGSITLREALSRLVAQAANKKTQENAESTTQPATQPSTKPASPTTRPSPPKWEWVMVKGLDGVLFPVGGDAGMECLPITPPVRTGLVDVKRLYREHRPLQEGATAAGERMAQIIFPAEGTSDKQPTAQETGGNLFSASGVTVWQLVGFAPAGEPTAMTAELRKQVEKDVETEKAFKLAWEDARQIKARAEANDTGLVAAVRDDRKVKYFDTEPLARKINVLLWNCVYAPGDVEPTKDEVAEAQNNQLRYALAMLSEQKISREEFERVLADVQKEISEGAEKTKKMVRDSKLQSLLQRISSDHRRQIMEAVFKLAPKNVEPPYADKPLAVEVIAIAPTQEVLVVQRKEGDESYEPPAKDEYRAKQKELAMQLGGISRLRAKAIWFNLDNIKRRTGYVETQKPAQTTEKTE